jgi:hypothetical protein
MVYRPMSVSSVPSQTIPVAEVSGKNWHYDVSFPVYNSSALERLIQCESQGRNISRTDSNGQMSWGILQFNGTSTWNEMEQRFNFYGDPRNPSDAIHMADMMISRGLIGRWACARSLEWSNSRAPLLAPSPLRTGREGFPLSGSSTQKRSPEKRGRGLIQNE